MVFCENSSLMDGIFFLPIKEIYEMNVCLLRKSVVKSRNFGKADVE